MITGESRPATRNEGDRVVAGTVATDNSIRVRVTAVGEATTLAGNPASGRGGARIPFARASPSRPSCRVLVLLRGRDRSDQLFDADISGRDFPRGKPDPMIFLKAAAELGLSPEACFVVEGATSGVQAAKAGAWPRSGLPALATKTCWRR